MNPRKPVITLFVLIMLIGVPATIAQIDWKDAQSEAEEADRTASVNASQAVLQTARVQSTSVRVAYETFYVATLQHRLQVFAWQALASKIIFGLVVTLVLSGMLLSALQFYFALRRGIGEVTQEVEVSLQGVKVRSQFLGVITLALSLAFFYLYLSTVYPVGPVGRPATAAQSK